MTATGESLTYVISLEEVAWGIVLIAATMVIHAFAMPATLSASNALHRKLSARPGFFSGVPVLLLASLMIVLAHLVEVIIWAAFFYFSDAMPTPSAACYFSLLQYTTVGSDLALPDRWRLLGGMIPMAGLLTFAWSTTVLLTLAQRFQQEQVERIDGRRRKESQRQ